ncbi:response regulator with CheY-like receiver domain and winged-helix DNA-binding domain [Mesorhizobium australicum WSM2073]|uniref:Response regulator with CheY-like receiver domain and winged-helix DNA-binding domain n=3 Tax=Mesorhizobium TaxID=68287 RepID=L0KS97_MESAW|nr:response regulator receiver [Mesorhizobium ciceri biovar biserrulae WSM1271]AEH90624.1 two component transcriptional regulator, winged helix family [Mesorhizobium opportunistum WSM2075]AGB47996.1 response regulator with CheY-like receiver domain and winged-helix DNA-binding domain [Mesorhizobium australicum WSM2073]OBP90842.1 response regulator receiver protein [Mesorhizobium loti]
MRILLIEDSEDFGSAVREHMIADGHAVEWAKDLSEARYHASGIPYGLVLLDINLPDGNGLDYLREMRKGRDSTPVIIVTARHTVEDRIEGLNAGAADYLVKPFDPRELSARIHAVARSHGNFPKPYSVGALSINAAERRVALDGQPVNLTAREWAILDCVLSRPGAVVLKRKIEEELLSLGSESESNTVEVYVSRLRKKIGRDRIATLRGLGYSFVEESRNGLGDPVDLVQKVRSVVDDFLKKPWFAGRLILDVDGCPAWECKADHAVRIPVVLRYLIDNALTHGLPDIPTTVSVRADGTIAIVNAGPVVPLPDLDEITERFVRLATRATVPGQGLPVANYVIKKVGGSLELASPATGREDGFEAIIRIPR